MTHFAIQIIKTLNLVKFYFTCLRIFSMISLKKKKTPNSLTGSIYAVLNREQGDTGKLRKYNFDLKLFLETFLTESM